MYIISYKSVVKLMLVNLFVCGYVPELYLRKLEPVVKARIVVFDWNKSIMFLF